MDEIANGSLYIIDPFVFNRDRWIYIYHRETKNITKDDFKRIDFSSPSSIFLSSIPAVEIGTTRAREA